MASCPCLVLLPAQLLEAHFVLTENQQQFLQMNPDKNMFSTCQEAVAVPIFPAIISYWPFCSHERLSKQATPPHAHCELAAPILVGLSLGLKASHLNFIKVAPRQSKPHLVMKSLAFLSSAILPPLLILYSFLADIYSKDYRVSMFTVPFV